MDREREHFTLNRWWKQNAMKTIWICVPVCRLCRLICIFGNQPQRERDRRTKRKKRSSFLSFMNSTTSFKLRFFSSWKPKKKDLKRTQVQKSKPKWTQSKTNNTSVRFVAVLLSKRNVCVFCVCAHGKIVNGHHRWIHFANYASFLAIERGSLAITACVSVRMKEKRRQ